MQRAVAFFRDVLGLHCMGEGARITAFDAGRQGVLRLCRRGASISDMPEPAGLIPGHDGTGPLHMAFAIAADSFDEWQNHLQIAGVKMRGKMLWPAGGKSLYFEDPDRHVLELATPGVWPNY